MNLKFFHNLAWMLLSPETEMKLLATRQIRCKFYLKAFGIVAQFVGVPILTYVIELALSVLTIQFHM